MQRVDDFSLRTKTKLARRVNYNCSNPDCGRPTSGPTSDTSDGTVSIGVAAHITAASKGGPRFDSAMTSAERSSIQNGIWLCQNCGTIIDRDPARFPASLLEGWKAATEEKCRTDLGNRYPNIAAEDFDSDQEAAQQDILLGALEGHEGNMIVFGDLNGWDVVTIIGENYNTSQFERSLFVQSMLDLLDLGLARKRGTDRAYELTFKGLKKAHSLRDFGLKRRKPGNL